MVSHINITMTEASQRNHRLLTMKNIMSHENTYRSRPCVLLVTHEDNCGIPIPHVVCTPGLVTAHGGQVKQERGGSAIL